eukprot:4360838-Karenia_brevis.AAC.1
MYYKQGKPAVECMVPLLLVLLMSRTCCTATAPSTNIWCARPAHLIHEWPVVPIPCVCHANDGNPEEDQVHGGTMGRLLMVPLAVVH